MDVMGVAPRVVRSEDESVGDVTESVVHGRVVGESTVAGIVTDTEDATAGEALEPPVRRPETPLGGENDPGVHTRGAQRLSERVDALRELVEGGAHDEITESPGDTLQGVLLVEVFRDSIVNLLQGDLRKAVWFGQASLVSGREEST